MAARQKYADELVNLGHYFLVDASLLNCSEHLGLAVCWSDQYPFCHYLSSGFEERPSDPSTPGCWGSREARTAGFLADDLVIAGKVTLA